MPMHVVHRTKNFHTRGEGVAFCYIHEMIRVKSSNDTEMQQIDMIVILFPANLFYRDIKKI